MPVPPSSSTVGRRSSSYTPVSSYTSYRSTPTSYFNRTTSLDRTSYSSSYGGYTGLYLSNKYSYRPPRTTYYSSATDSYRSSRSLRVSPVRSGISRLSSETRLPSAEPSDSRSFTSRLRDNSVTRDSGYGSRYTSRDRSADNTNGNLDLGSVIAARYRWDSRDIERAAKDEDEPKVRVGDRIRAFEGHPPSVRRLGGSSYYARDESLAQGPIGRPSEAKEKEGEPGAAPLKEDVNHNVPNGVVRSDDEETTSSDSSGSRESPPLSGTKASSLLKEAQQVQEVLREEVNGVDSSLQGVEIPNESPVEDPSSRTREEPFKEQPRHRQASPVLNGVVEKRKALDSAAAASVEVDSLYDSSALLARSRLRRERIRDRIAARLASELEDEGYSSNNQRSQSENSSKSFSENGGLVGLRNIGNTCFLNSITQCLSNTKCLMEYVVREGYTSDINGTVSKMKGDLIIAFANLLSGMWCDGGYNNRALNTGPFKEQVQRFAPAFSGYQQHDAQEFLRKLLEGLHEDVNRVIKRQKSIMVEIDENLDDGQKAIEAWKQYLRFDDSKIVDMFVGQLKSSLQCSVCTHCSVTFDPFWDLSLPIPSKSGQVKLYQCLDLFTKEEVLDGDERPTCSKCKERRRMTKSFSIQKFPKVLVLHLKRFSPHERWRGKLSCTVDFPLNGLDLSRYASNRSTGCQYQLIGVANHSGTTYSGHYTAYCRHPYSGAWHEYNDSRVTSIPPSRVCSAEAYVLFYELTSTSSKL